MVNVTGHDLPPGPGIEWHGPGKVDIGVNNGSCGPDGAVSLGSSDGRRGGTLIHADGRRGPSIVVVDNGTMAAITWTQQS